MGLLDGKAAVVTGSGRGIGKGHALQLAKAGASVVVNDIDEEVAAEVVAQIEGFGGTAIANTGSVGEKSGAESIVKSCIDAFGKIDIMMANAGIARDRTFLKMSEEEFDAVMNVHVKGTFLCHQSAALQMKEQGTGGCLISTVSAAHFGNFGQTNYAGAKGAIASMTYTMAMELARYGIRANAISPSGTTRMSDTYVGPDGKKHEMPFIDPELNGPVLIYLCSDEGNYISGQIFGTGGERIALLEQPKYGHTLFMPGGWTVEDVQNNFKPNLGNKLEAIGITKPPYPFSDGVKVPEPK
ncbi:MAG: NAD(P)-dependent dehydrogenase (short-subunit alcohol dehydrogenase family) [Halioglobus sp.]|jgi:NAD(P)-dependent dehydrogenase (short-subunit alcohol dehydrogenase family)